MRPAISVAEITVTESTDEALALGCTLELTNPNSVPLNLYELTYVLAVDSKPVYEGRRAAVATLSAAGTRLLTIPAIIPNHRMGWDASSRPQQVRFTLTGTLVYNKPGDIARLLFGAGVRRPKAHFAHRGQLQLPSPP